MEYPDEWILRPSYETALITPHPNFATCSKGTVKVRGYIDCGGTRRYSNWSSAQTLRTIPSLQVTASGQTSYTLSCGNTDPLTFTMPAISCASGYSWVFPAGWTTVDNLPSPVTTAANTLTLKPKITPANASTVQGTVVGTAVLPCANFQAQPFTLAYNDEQFNTSIVETSRSLMCSNNSGTVSLSQTRSDLSYSWYSVSNLLKINNQTATAGSPLITPTGSVTISTSLLKPNVGFAADVIMTVVGKPGCNTGGKILVHKVWGGKPSIVYFPTPPNQNPCSNSPTYRAPNLAGTVEYFWEVSNPSVWLLNNGSWLTSVTDLNGYPFDINVTMQEANCVVTNTLTDQVGNGLYCECFQEDACLGQGSTLSVYPNPTAETFEITIDNTSEGEELLYLYSYTLSDENNSILMEGSGKKRNISLSLNQYPDGVYYLHVFLPNNKKSSRRLIKKTSH